jgi:hypothetical protein
MKGERIVPTLPGTSYLLAFYKQPDGSIRQSEASMEDTASDVPRKIFEKRAWDAANRKARQRYKQQERLPDPTRKR